MKRKLKNIPMRGRACRLAGRRTEPFLTGSPNDSNSTTNHSEMMKYFPRHLLFLIIFVTFHGVAAAQIELPRLVSDGMVLQRDADVEIGRASCRDRSKMWGGCW